MIKTQFEHGEWVEVRRAIWRKKTQHVKSGNSLGTKNTWERVPLTTPYRAIFLGGRQLSDCFHFWDGCGDEAYLVMENENTQNGALVCQKNRNPVKVLLSDVYKITEPLE